MALSELVCSSKFNCCRTNMKDNLDTHTYQYNRVYLNMNFTPAICDFKHHSVAELASVCVPVFLWQGGNDYEIYCDPRTIGHEVSCPEETRQLCQQLFFSWERSCNCYCMFSLFLRDREERLLLEVVFICPGVILRFDDKNHEFHAERDSFIMWLIMSRNEREESVTHEKRYL